MLVVWSFDLDEMGGQLRSKYAGEFLDDRIELSGEGGESETFELEGEVAETELLSFEVLDLFFFSPLLAEVEQSQNEAAQQVETYNSIQQPLAGDG